MWLRTRLEALTTQSIRELARLASQSLRKSELLNGSDGIYDFSIGLISKQSVPDFCRFGPLDFPFMTKHGGPSDLSLNLQ